MQTEYKTILQKIRNDKHLQDVIADLLEELQAARRETMKRTLPLIRPTNETIWDPNVNLDLSQEERQQLDGKTLFGEGLVNGVHLEDTSKDSFCDLPKIGRYGEIGLLGIGGMGEVYQVRDYELNRTIAMKIIHRYLSENEIASARFIEEGQICAQLEHPNIVPVYEIGKLDDGRLYFTMKAIKGTAFNEAIREVHKAIVNNQWQVTASGLSFRKLIDIFCSVCQAMSYAHSKGVIHRDLKPENIMIGEYGEILVVDWGIAKILGTNERDFLNNSEELIKTDRAKKGLFKTRIGQISGTPEYMPPEQAAGRIDLIDERSDIYSLGTILYEVLTGKAPYEAVDRMSVLQQVLDGPPKSIYTIRKEIETKEKTTLEELEELNLSNIESTSEKQLPLALVNACEKAMARNKEERHQSVIEFSKEVGDWLEGAKKEEEALKVVEQAMRLNQNYYHMDLKARELFDKAEKGLKEVHTWEAERFKTKWWEMEHQAQELQQKVDLIRVLHEQKLHAALTHKSDLEEAHLALAKFYKEEHQILEAKRNISEAKKFELRLRENALALPDSNRWKKKFLTYLEGTGEVEISLDTGNVVILLEEFLSYYKRLIVRPLMTLGKSSHLIYSLQKGSYRLRLKKQGHHEVVYPFLISRGELWESFDISGKERLVHVPKEGILEKDECFIPGGWFWAGGDPENTVALSQKRIWIDDFVIQKFPITNQEYIVFLDDLVREGREDEALAYVPFEKNIKLNQQKEMVYGRNPDGTFTLLDGLEKELSALENPVVSIDWFSAKAYADWKAKKTGKPYRLLHELEWEKAARGVDGRYFPWGDHFDPAFCCMRLSVEGKLTPVKINSFAIDQSPYGVRGLGGNVQDWCYNDWTADWMRVQGLDWTGSFKAALNMNKFLEIIKQSPNNSLKTARGGRWNGGVLSARSASRFDESTTTYLPSLGFRLGYSL